jgi:hypothetical protein
MAAPVNLKHRRCFNHAGREASARCPVCGKDFCRECITEHKGKMLCVNCLKENTRKKIDRRKILVPVFYTILLAVTLIAIFLCFVSMGRGIAFREVDKHQGASFKK